MRSCRRRRLDQDDVMSLSTFGLNWTRAHDSWIRLIRSIHPSSLYTTTPDSFSQTTFSLKMTKEKQRSCFNETQPGWGCSRGGEAAVEDLSVDARLCVFLLHKWNPCVSIRSRARSQQRSEVRGLQCEETVDRDTFQDAVRPGGRVNGELQQQSGRTFPPPSPPTESCSNNRLWPLTSDPLWTRRPGSDSWTGWVNAHWSERGREDDSAARRRKISLIWFISVTWRYFNIHTVKI